MGKDHDLWPDFGSCAVSALKRNHQMRNEPITLEIGFLSCGHNANLYFFFYLLTKKEAGAASYHFGVIAKLIFLALPRIITNGLFLHVLEFRQKHGTQIIRWFSVVRICINDLMYFLDHLLSNSTIWRYFLRVNTCRVIKKEFWVLSTTRNK